MTDWKPIETAPVGSGKLCLSDESGYLVFGWRARDEDGADYWQIDFADNRKFPAKYWSNPPTPPDQVRIDREVRQREDAILAEAERIRVRRSAA